MNNIEMETTDGENLDFPTKNNRRAVRRHNSVTKAIRKRNITRHVYGRKKYEWFNNLHQYSKNKIHCSCYYCSFHGNAVTDLKADAKYDYDLKHYDDLLEMPA